LKNSCGHEGLKGDRHAEQGDHNRGRQRQPALDQRPVAMCGVLVKSPSTIPISAIIAAFLGSLDRRRRCRPSSAKATSPNLKKS
jgi:hypothetical protein